MADCTIDNEGECVEAASKAKAELHSVLDSFLEKEQGFSRLRTGATQDLKASIIDVIKFLFKKVRDVKPLPSSEVEQLRDIAKVVGAGGEETFAAAVELLLTVVEESSIENFRTSLGADFSERAHVSNLKVSFQKAANMKLPPRT